MQAITFTLLIQAFDQEQIDCLVSNALETNYLTFFLKTNTILFRHENQLATNIRNNKHQFEKILHSACCRPLTAGQTISCVFLENFTFLKEEDFLNFIRIDRREKKLNISTSALGLSGVKKIYADGSFMPQSRQAGYGGFIENPDGTRKRFSGATQGRSSNLTELLAITKGLQRLQEEEVIQINTDSRFVIRGLCQWVHFWRHNNWQSAYGRDVRHSSYWREADRLCEDKCIEFKWIKAHSGHEKQELCHQLAKNQVGFPRLNAQ